MHQRSELEKLHTLAEMQAIIDTFGNDLTEYSNKEVRLRIGVAKIVVEEYLPLFLLARSLPHFKHASLTADSHPGPDAVLLFDDGTQATVQITCAGEDKSTALQRELLNDGKIVFANQSITRNRKSGEITQCGRVLTTKTKNTLAAIEEVLSAIKNKTRKYRAGTQFLLVSIRRSEITMSKNWKPQLLAAVSSLTDLPYERIYVTTAHTCFACKQGA